MDRNNVKRIFKGVVLSLVLCASLFTFFSFPISAAVTTEYYAEVVSSYINVREGPGLSYSIVTQYAKGFCFDAVQADYVEADGYRWYSCPDGWIAQTGGLKFAVRELVSDRILFYSAFGSVSWDHTCDGDGSTDWGYTITVLDDGYWVYCDCGAAHRTILNREVIADAEGNIISDIYFQGLDTDNDERVDLYPGQSKFLPNRGNSDLRPYQILEFFDQAVVDIPTVTVILCDKDYKELKRYTFAFSCYVRVLTSGIELTGQDGTYEYYNLPDNVIVTDKLTGVMIADRGISYAVNFDFVDLSGNMFNPHPEYVMVIAPPGEGPNGFLENVVDNLKDVCGSTDSFFSDFGNLDDIFSDADSPVSDILSGVSDGEQSVFYLIRQFISLLPREVTYPVLALFMLTLAFGILRLFL